MALDFSSKAEALDFTEQADTLDFTEQAEEPGFKAPETFYGHLDIPLKMAADKLSFDNMKEIGLNPVEQFKNIVSAGEDIATQTKSGLLAGLLKRIWSDPQEPTADDQYKMLLRRDQGDVAAILDEMEAVGQTNTPEYDALAQEFGDLGKAIAEKEGEKPSAWETVKTVAEFIKENPTQAGAEFVNAILSDPELAIAPVGYTATGSKALVTAKALGASAKMAKTAEVTAGLAGVAATAAAIEAPLSVERQLQESGEVSATQVMADSAIAGALSVPIVGAMKGISGSYHYLGSTARSILNNPIHQPLTSVGAKAAKGAKITEQAVRPPSGTKQFFSDAINFAAGKSIIPVVKVAKRLPSLQKIVDKLFPDELGKRAVGPVFHERVSRAIGTHVTKMQDALMDVSRGFTGKLPKRMRKEVVAALRGEQVSLRAQKAAHSIRKVMDDIHKYAKDAGVDIGYIKNYFPRIYNTGKLMKLKHQRAFKDVLMRHGMDELTADDVIRNIVDQDGLLTAKKTHGYQMDLTDPDAMSGSFWAKQARHKKLGGETRGAKSRFAELSRKLNDIPDAELAPFLDDNPHSALIKYAENVIHRAEWVRAFGKDGAKLNKLLGKAIQEGADSGVHGTDMKAAVRRVYDIVDALQKNYHPVHTSTWRTFNRVLTTYQNFRTLAHVTITSLPEIWAPFLRADLSSNVKAIIPTMKHATSGMIRTVYKKFPKAQATRALEESGLGLESAIIERLASAFGGEITGASQFFFKAIGLEQWTKFTRVFANESGKNMIIGHLKHLAKGPKGPFKKAHLEKYTRELRELGINVDEGLNWYKAGADMKAPFYKNIENGGIRFTNEVIMNPQVVNRPMWHSNPHFHFAMQLKGFQTTFGNTVVKRMARELFQRGLVNSMESAVKYATVVGLMTYTALLGNKMREHMVYGEGGNPRFEDETPQQEWFRAMERTGFTGAYQFGLDATLAHRFGSSGWGALLGPTGSQTGQLMKAAGEAREGRYGKFGREVGNAIPIVNRFKEPKEAVREYIVEALEE